MVPKQFVEESIKQLAEKGTRALILITAGFKETGKEGEQEEKRFLSLLEIPMRDWSDQIVWEL